MLSPILFNFLFFILPSLDARLNILNKKQSPIRGYTKHGSYVTRGHEESTDQTSILCKNIISLLVWYVSNCQDIYACTDEIFEQNRKSEASSVRSSGPTPERRTLTIKPEILTRGSLWPAPLRTRLVLGCFQIPTPDRQWGREMSAPTPHQTDPFLTQSSVPPLESI